MKNFFAKLKKTFKKHKKVFIGTAIFLSIGVLALFFGFEIANDWHAIRNWVQTPYFKTAVILIVIGIALLILIFIELSMIKDSNKYDE